MRDENLPTLCCLCRLPMKEAERDRSVCLKCVPADESELSARRRVETLTAEARALHASCEDHVRIRNEMGDVIVALRDAADDALAFVNHAIEMLNASGWRHTSVAAGELRDRLTAAIAKAK